MKKQIIGLIFGAIAGMIDIVPMIIQGLTWDANLSALSMWIVIGFFTASVELKINPIFKGVLIAFMVLLPSAFLIGWANPVTLIPIFIMTFILSVLLGFTIHKFTVHRK